jgi:cholesterol oxidase
VERSRAQHDFDAVVVGSGFGGSVMAYRLAAAGMRVCVLERGRKYPPGSFARSPLELRGNFWNPKKGTYGLFDVWSFRNIESAVSAGVGGGSLIYANVLIRKDENWFVTDGRNGASPWPVTRKGLDPYYNLVENMLAPETFPATYFRGSKTAAMCEAAREMKIDVTDYMHVDCTKPQFYLPQLAITFANPGDPPRRGVPILHDLPPLR